LLLSPLGGLFYFDKQEAKTLSKRKNRRKAPSAKGYSEAGASLDRRSMRGFTPKSGSPNEDINRNNYTLRQRARIL